jgi:hypothetical protein
MMDIEQLKQLINDTPNDTELGRKIRELYFQLEESNTKRKYVNPYNGKVE